MRVTSWFNWSLVGVVLIAAGLRFWQLGQVPHGLSWDEAATGYNGYAMLTTRRDEWLVRFPVSFKSFGDFKAPLAIYLNGPFTWALGSTAMAVRLPYAVAGVFAVVGMMGLSWTLTSWAQQKPGVKRVVTLTTGALLATLPWHLHFSRIAFESGLALTILIWAVWGWWWVWSSLATSARWLKRPWWWLVVCTSVGLLVASLYAYHSAKLVTPLLAVTLFLVHWRWQRRQVGAGLVATVLGAVLARPLLLDSIQGSGAERFNQASVFTKGWPWTEVASKVVTHFVVHLQPSFLWQGATTTLRHGDGQWGVLFWPTAAVMFLGFSWGIWWWRQTQTVRTRYQLVQRLWVVAVVWVVAGLLPAAIGIDVPHSNRALLAAPGMLLLAAGGAVWLWQLLLDERRWHWQGTHGESHLLAKSVLGTLALVQGLLTASYLHQYYGDFARASAAEFQDGYLEAFNYVVPYEKGQPGFKEVDKVLFTSEYGQPYIYALLVRRTNPIWYQGGSLIKYEFTDQIKTSDLDRHNTIVVAGQRDSLPTEKADKLILGSDGAVRFKIYVLP